MKLINPQNKLPDLEKEVLIKYKDIGGKFRYYITELERKENELVFIEAIGERYMYWDIDEVIGWMYASELDNIQ